MTFKQNTQNNTLKSGIVVMVLSTIFFAILYIFSSLMHPMSGTEVFAWRMVAMLIGLCGIIGFTGKVAQMIEFVTSLGWSAKKWFMLLLPTPIVASQFWLFMWGPVNGYAVDVAMGYFLLPLTIVACAWLFLQESISKSQSLALVFAALGVAYQAWDNQSLSFVTFWICASYPAYYLLRRHQGVPALFGLTIDLAIIAPFAFLYLIVTGDIATVFEPSKFWLLIPLLGLLSALAMQFNLDACRLLPVPVFGMLSYLEPALMFLLALTVLDATVTPQMMVTFGFIWAGLIVSMTDSWLKLKSQSMASQTTTH